MNNDRFAAFVTPAGVTFMKSSSPVLFGVPEIKLDLEPQSIIVHEWRVHQLQITAKQDDMGTGLGAQVRLREDDDIQRLRELLMKQLHLIDTGLHVPLDSGLLEVQPGEVIVIDFVAILAMGTLPGVGAGVGEIQRRIIPELANQVQVVLPHHLQGVVVAKVPVQHHVGQGDHPGDQVQQGVEPACKSR